MNRIFSRPNKYLIVQPTQYTVLNIVFLIQILNTVINLRFEI